MADVADTILQRVHLLTMTEEHSGEEETELSTMDPHQTDNGQNYITVIPVEYPRKFITEYTASPADQYAREYLRDRPRDDYLRSDYTGSTTSHFDDLTHLYSVSQHYDRDGFDRTSFERGSFDRERYERDRRVPPQGAASVPVRTMEDVQPSNDTHRLQPVTQQKYRSKKKFLEFSVYLPSKVAFHLDLEDGGRVTVREVYKMMFEEDEIGLPPQSANVFALWMTSPYLEVQLKPYHRPLQIRRDWPQLLEKYTQLDPERHMQDHPILSFERNAFFPKRDEVKLRDTKTMELLYEEAKYNILDGRYPCELMDYEMLAGIQARLEFGPYNPHVHTPGFFRSHIRDLLPEHACSSRIVNFFAGLGIGGKSSPEIHVLEQFKNIPATASPRKLVRKYLEFCWSLPYYGSVFFHGQVERPAGGVNSLMSLASEDDCPVLIAINDQGVHVIDPMYCTVLLGLKYEEMSWDFARPAQEKNPDCLPCLFLQFQMQEYGRRVSKILQIFSKQAIMMDALISEFVDDLRRRHSDFGDETDGHRFDNSTDVDDVLVPLTTVSRREIPESCLANKLNRLTLATFDEEGKCVNAQGSWAFSH